MAEHIPHPNMVAKAIDACKTAAELARRLGVTRQAIYQWDKIPADRVVDIEVATGIPREELRPDLYRRAGAEPTSEAA